MKILFLTDFSDNAYNALFYTSQLFRDSECRFYIMNTYTEHTSLMTNKVGDASGRELLSQLEDESSEGLKQVYHRINLDIENEKHSFEIIPSIHGNLQDAAVKTAEEKQVDMAVLGRKDRTEAGMFYFGNKTGQLVKSLSKFAVLIIPEQFEFKIPADITFATDYKASFDASELDPLLRIARLHNSAIRILHIKEEGGLSTEQKSNLNTLRAYFSDISHTIHWMPDYTSKSKNIQAFTEELETDMLAMVYYEHNRLVKLLREPVITRISRNIDIPFLILPAGE